MQARSLGPVFCEPTKKKLGSSALPILVLNETRKPAEA